MLDAFIIEEIKRRERERTDDDRPVVELPLPQPSEPAHQDDERPERPDGSDRDRRGVVIIDYSG